MVLAECFVDEAESPPRPVGLSRYGVTCERAKLLVISLGRLPTALPNCGDVLRRLPGLGFTVISRYLAGISADPPQMFEVPNPSVDVDSWEG